MKVVLVLCALVGVSLGAALPSQIFEDWEGRIVGGHDAVEGQFPYQASLRFSIINFHFCGGTIYNSFWVVSAAHCTDGRTAANTVVVLGARMRTTGGDRYTLSRLVNHPNYNGNTLTNDICVLRTSTEILFNAFVAPIPLSTVHTGGDVAAVASGWGQTSNPGNAADTLQFLNVRTLTNAQCQQQHTTGNAAFVFENTICTFTQTGEGMCMGDSGGPLVVGNSVVGAVSWGIACAQGFPDVYARISSHVPWINGVMAESL